MFEAGVLSVIRLYQRLPFRLPHWRSRVLPKTIAGLASFWVLEPVTGFVVCVNQTLPL